jgi:hypothetical protein
MLMLPLVKLLSLQKTQAGCHLPRERQVVSCLCLLMNREQFEQSNFNAWDSLKKSFLTVDCGVSIYRKYGYVYYIIVKIYINTVFGQIFPHFRISY